MKKWVALLILISAKVWAVQPIASNIMKEYQQTKENLALEEQKQRKVLAVLYDINKQMHKIVTQKGSLVQERMVLENNVKNLAKTILDLEKDIKEKRLLIKDRMLVMYKVGGQGLMRVLMSSMSADELDRNIKILSLVAKRDYNLAKGYMRSVELLSEKKTKLMDRVAYLKKLEGDIKIKERSLTSQQESKNKLLSQIKSSQTFKISKLQGLREKDTGVLDLLFRPSFYEQKGKLMPPVAGFVKQGFGLIKDSENEVTISHKGYFYSAPMHTPVYSVFDGNVAYADWIPGLGNTVVIDHGDHYYTVYSHLDSLHVQLNREVKSGQMLAFSSDTSQEFGPGIYFEIRHFSEPNDPKLWLKQNQQLQISATEEM